VAVRSNIDELVERLRKRGDELIVILASGDPGFYGIAGTLARHFSSDEMEIVPHVTSLQSAFARIGVAWSDAILTSAHARSLSEVVGWAKRVPKLGILTDGEHTPGRIAQTLIDAGLDDCRAVVVESVGLPEERLTDERLVNLPEMEFAPLNVLLLVRREGWRPKPVFAPRSDDDYAHRRGLITKGDVRALSLARLAIGETDVVWDIGAGSGAMSVEMAELAWRGQVLAIERDAENVGYIRQNVSHFGTLNVTVVEGQAPTALAGLPEPAAVFVGGTGGEMRAILDHIDHAASPGCRVVVNVVTLENLSRCLDVIRTLGWTPQVTQANLAQGREIADMTRLSPLNPVFIVSTQLAG
jgi:precorrin-6Y C5,15-methyltransferase (decarboxylating)